MTRILSNARPSTRARHSPRRRALGAAVAIALWSLAAHAAPDAYTCVAPAARPAERGLMLATRQYDLTYYKPVMSIEHRPYVARVVVAKTRSKTWSYDVPTLRAERRILWKYPDFSCRYPLGVLPNDCETVWRNAYADLPVLTTERDHLTVDVPDWRWQDETFHVDIPRWSYVEQHLLVGVPAVVAEDSCAVFVGEAARMVADPAVHADARAGQRPTPADTRASLQAERAIMLSAIDQGIASVDSAIAAINSAAGDVKAVVAENGDKVDLDAMRAGLVDQRAKERERFDRMIDQLTVLDAEGAAGTAMGPAAAPVAPVARD